MYMNDDQNSTIIISEARYRARKGNNVAVICKVNDKMMAVPIDENNGIYREIVKQTSAGTLTIQEAE